MAPDFPGFSQNVPFECQVEVDPAHVAEIPDVRFAEAMAESTLPQRVARCVELILGRQATLADREPEPDVVICALPTIVEAACRRQFARGAREIMRHRPNPRERAETRFRRSSRKARQELFDFGDTDGDAWESLDLEWDLHDSLKARAMEFGIPIQVLWESTLASQEGNQDPATLAWNLMVGLYYKAGNIPWSLDGLPTGTCFVGISFYRETRRTDANLSTALAQVFAESGEGLVLRGGQAQIDIDGDRQPHLSAEEASLLVRQSVDLYERHFHQKPQRVVIHKTSRFAPPELTGIRQGLLGVPVHDLVALQRRGIRFFRLGHEPPVRGTVIHLARRNYLLYTQGFLPSLGMYPGMRVPEPVEIVEHHGDSAAERICGEILALTKLNWNTCSFAPREPITVAFSKKIGTILRDLPEHLDPQPKYRFYM